MTRRDWAVEWLSGMCSLMEAVRAFDLPELPMDKAVTLLDNICLCELGEDLFLVLTSRP